ncbi:unnamed protein product [Rotaria socialis]|uniref:Uncharacterized protein n=1 Tax=Rotaria socialis TaxID=392032 RepID=A0A820YVI1_9BILA|nr:unnamed protein product [Rotaria socialis]CAF4553845.1 unnamed protein product [Rotaria socialis]
MDLSLLPVLPSGIIDRISEELSGVNLFHFTLANEWHLTITTYHLIQLLRLQCSLSLENEIKSLIDMSKSPYMITENGISLVLSPCKWNNFVYGAFKMHVIAKSLKYYSTDMFFLYCRLWAFSPFYYESSYPTLDVFDYTYLFEPRPLSVDECALFKVWGNNQSPPKLVLNFDQFIKNLKSQYEYDIWRSYIDWNLFVIAGGSIVSCLLVQPFTGNTSDIDLFFLKENPRLFKNAVNALETRLQTKYFVRRKTIWSNRLIQFDLYQRFTINDIFNGTNFSPSIVLQLIRPTMIPITISRMLHSFDLDICGAAFNSQKVIISFSCLQALNSGHTTCYCIPVTPSQFMRRVPRLYKYQQRGFNILCPHQFDINKFLATCIEDCKESQPERTYRFQRRFFGDNCDSFCIQKKFCEHYRLI